MSSHSPGPWNHNGVDFWDELGGKVGTVEPRLKVGAVDPRSHGVRYADARLIAAAPDLLDEARVLHCLASSPRFQKMTVAEALSEMHANGCGHDGGAAIAKAEGK